MAQRERRWVGLCEAAFTPRYASCRRPLCPVDGPTFATPSSYADALRAASAAVALVDVIASATPAGSSQGRGEQGSGDDVGGSGDHAEQGRAAQGAAELRCGTLPSPPVGFSICRPPGHHATPGDQMGFCLLNNAALAARRAQRAHGLQKVGTPPPRPDLCPFFWRPALVSCGVGA